MEQLINVILNIYWIGVIVSALLTSGVTLYVLKEEIKESSAFEIIATVIITTFLSWYSVIRIILALYEIFKLSRKEKKVKRQ